jgi:2,3-bisphosphoglycerate-dependent phosphoglycerate mutase
MNPNPKGGNLMRILLVRHGFSIGNENEENYTIYGDSNVPLTDRGWFQAYRAGEFLKSFYTEKSGAAIDPPRLWSSSFKRTLETTRGLLHGAQGAFVGEPILFEDPRLIEQSFGWLNHLRDQRKDMPNSEMIDQFLALSRHFWSQEPFIARAPFGESPQDAYSRIDDFIATLSRDFKQGIFDHLIVSHGATIKAFMMRWFHLPMEAWSQLKTPHNCDVFCIERDSYAPVRPTKAHWVIHKIFDGETGQPCHINPIAGLVKRRVEDLPQFPDHLQNLRLDS